VTILSIGATLYRVTKTADILQSKYGVSAEIIDARSLVPFNYEPVIESIKKTGTHRDHRRCLRAQQLHA
jgi:2-oxoisovalerate dehydrogenase E1 component